MCLVGAVAPAFRYIELQRRKSSKKGNGGAPRELDDYIDLGQGANEEQEYVCCFCFGAHGCGVYFVSDSRKARASGSAAASFWRCIGRGRQGCLFRAPRAVCRVTYGCMRQAPAFVGGTLSADATAHMPTLLLFCGVSRFVCAPAGTIRQTASTPRWRGGLRRCVPPIRRATLLAVGTQAFFQLAYT